MRLRSLSIEGVRNLSELTIEPGSGINLLYGDNGAGKTSVLESIFILAHGNTFRPGRIQTVVNENLSSLTVSALVEDQKSLISTRVGIIRGGNLTQARIDSSNVTKLSELAAALPCVVITAKNYELIEGGPAERRSFFDWLLFHVDQSYLPLYRRYKNAIQQRNAALRSGAHKSLIQNWDVDISESGEYITKKRIQVINHFTERYSNLVEVLDEELRPTFVYRKGWSQDLNLLDALSANIQNCQRIGMTSVGPHRADLKISLGSKEAKYVNSRGQQKLLAILMKLVQVELFASKNGQPPIILIDDPPSELDEATSSFVFDFLADASAQVFLTSVDDVSKKLQPCVNVFHVKRGIIQKVVY